MTEEIKPQEATPQAPPDCVLTIKLRPDGHIDVNGMLDNEPLMFWMMDKAKDTIKARNMKLALKRRNIVNARGGIMGFIKRRF